MALLGKRQTCCAITPNTQYMHVRRKAKAPPVQAAVAAQDSSKKRKGAQNRDKQRTKVFESNP